METSPLADELQHLGLCLALIEFNQGVEFRTLHTYCDPGPQVSTDGPLHLVALTLRTNSKPIHGITNKNECGIEGPFVSFHRYKYILECFKLVVSD